MPDDSWKPNSSENWRKTWRPLGFPNQDFLGEVGRVEKCSSGNGVTGVFLPPEKLVVGTAKVGST